MIYNFDVTIEQEKQITIVREAINASREGVAGVKVFESNQDYMLEQWNLLMSSIKRDANQLEHRKLSDVFSQLNEADKNEVLELIKNKKNK